MKKALAEKMNEIEQLKSESETNVQRLTLEYEQKIEMERERAREAELASQQRYEWERKEAETNILKQLKIEMREKRLNYELELQEMSYQNISLQGKLAIIESELNQFKEENDTLNRMLHLSEKYVSDFDLQIMELQRDLKDKTDQIARLQDNLSSEQVKRRQLEEMPNNKQIPIISKTVCFKHLKLDILIL